MSDILVACGEITMLSIGVGFVSGSLLTILGLSLLDLLRMRRENNDAK